MCVFYHIFILFGDLSSDFSDIIFILLLCLWYFLSTEAIKDQIFGLLVVIKFLIVCTVNFSICLTWLRESFQVFIEGLLSEVHSCDLLAHYLLEIKTVSHFILNLVLNN